MKPAAPVTRMIVAVIGSSGIVGRILEGSDPRLTGAASSLSDVVA